MGILEKKLIKYCSIVSTFENVCMTISHIYNSPYNKYSLTLYGATTYYTSRDGAYLHAISILREKVYKYVGELEKLAENLDDIKKLEE